MDQPDLEGDAGLGDMLGDEIATIIDVEDLRDAADRPIPTFLAPDRLAEGEGRAHGRRRVETQEIAGDGTAVVVDDHCQPGLARRSLLIKQDDVEERMIGLPHCIRRFGFA